MAAPKILWLLIGASAWAQSSPVVWVASSLQSVKQTDRSSNNIHAQLSAAKGEYESFQIVVQAPRNHDLTNTSIILTELITSNGHVIPATDVTLFREHYVNVRSSSPDWGKSNRPLGPGQYPDALIPFIDPATGQPPRSTSLQAAPFSITAGTNQPVWVDVFVPLDASAGEYSGAFEVSSDQGKARGEISLRVWNFALPAQPSLSSAFLVWQKDQIAIGRMLLRNKITPLSTSPETIRKLAGTAGLKLAGLPFWSGADVSHCAMRPPPPLTDVRAAVAKLPRALDLVDYTADEVSKCPALYPTIQQWAYVLHQAGVKNLVTIAPSPELFDDGSGTGRSAVDIWAVLAEGYLANVDAIKRAIAKGDSVWSYTTLVQDGDSPKWEIDFPPINFRIQPGFLSQALNLSGIMYWRVDLWPSDPWKTVDTTGRFSSANFPGEGMLVYPGGEAGVRGVVPSMRLKWIRDGVEDYEYVALLKRLGLDSWARMVITGVAADWSHWTKDPNLLEAARRQLGEKLDAMAPAATPRKRDQRENAR
jgi:hypothetical protein